MKFSRLLFSFLVLAVGSLSLLAGTSEKSEEKVKVWVYFSNLDACLAGFVPHLTKAGSGFETRFVVTNNSDDGERLTIELFDKLGRSERVLETELNPGDTLNVNTADLLKKGVGTLGEPVSAHLGGENEWTVQYKHPNGTWTDGFQPQIAPGAIIETAPLDLNDGFHALLVQNVDSAPALVKIRQLDASGLVLEEKKVNFSEAPYNAYYPFLNTSNTIGISGNLGQREAIVLQNHFAHVEGAYYEVEGTQHIAVSGLHINGDTLAPIEVTATSYYPVKLVDLATFPVNNNGPDHDGIRMIVRHAFTVVFNYNTVGNQGSHGFSRGEAAAHYILGHSKSGHGAQIMGRIKYESPLGNYSSEMVELTSESLTINDQ